MAIVSVKELATGRSGTFDAESGFSHRRSFIVVSNSKNDADYTIAAATGITLYDAYVSYNSAYTDTSSRAKTATATCQSEAGSNGLCVWRVDWDYSPLEAEEPEEENPLDRPAEISWDFERVEEIVDVDINGNAIVNSAGMPFEPALTRDANRPLLIATKNYASFSASTAYNSINKLNSGTFFGAPAGTAKLNRLSASRHLENDVWFWAVTFEFAFNADGWNAAPLDQGLQQLNEDGDGWVNILDDDDKPITAPLPLDGEGYVLPADTDPADYFYGDFEIYDQIDFSTFGLE